LESKAARSEGGSPPTSWCWPPFTPRSTGCLPARANLGSERNVTQVHTPIVTEIRRGSAHRLAAPDSAHSAARHERASVRLLGDDRRARRARRRV